MGKTPVKKRKSRNAATASSLETVAEASFIRCPEGHPLPHKTDNGRCTPLLCAAKDVGHGMSRLRTDKGNASPEERIQKVTGDEQMRVKVQAARASVWQDFLKMPVDLKGADAEKYFDDQIVNMLPMAATILKKNLYFGTEEQQERAAQKVMDANGKGKKESVGNSTPPLVINLPPGANIQLPWRTQQATVEGTVAKAEEKK